MKYFSQIILFGTDLRQEAIKNHLRKQGYSTTNVLPSSLQKNSLFILPVPCPEQLIDQLANRDLTDCFVFGGAISDIYKNKLIHTHAKVYDYLSDPSLVLFNTIATAEGALCEGIMMSPYNLQGSSVLVLGYGRCGITLARKAGAMDANVSVYARRKEQQTLAFTQGFTPFSLEQSLTEFQYIFNTIPAKMLTKKELETLGENAVIIDIASAPGGVDFTYCKEHGINAKLCPGLPAKYSPDSSGKAIVNYLWNLSDHLEKGCAIES